jgi:hypothetical protein
LFSIPHGKLHGFRVSEVARRKLNSYAPAATVGYFGELADAIHAGSVGQDVLEGVAFRYSMEMLGPWQRAMHRAGSFPSTAQVTALRVAYSGRAYSLLAMTATKCSTAS